MDITMDIIQSPMESIDLAVILNSFNRLSLLKESLSSLTKAMDVSGLHYAVIIFEANSTDGSIDWIHDYIKKFDKQNIYMIVASKSEPDSFSYGVNKACEFATNKFPSLKYLFLYETDNYLTSFEPILNARKMLEEKKELAACGFTVKKHNGSNAGLGASFPTIASFVLGQQLSFKLKLNEPDLLWSNSSSVKFSYADIVYTSPLLIKAGSWQKIKGFDSKNFPFSDCDIDLAYRVKKNGERMGVVETEDVIHDNLEKRSAWSSKRTLNFYRARFAYFRKHHGNTVHLLKPILFIMHGAEWGMLGILCIMGKRDMNSLKVRWKLMKSVLQNYKLSNKEID